MDYLYIILIFCIGISLTSFYCVLGVRLPMKQTLLGRSKCDHCEKELRFKDVIPILGYFINKGKCYNCNKQISLLYPIIECLGGIGFVALYLIFGFSLDYFIGIVLLSVLIIETVSDIQYRIVIDLVWIIGVLFVVISRIIQAEIITHLISSAVVFIGLWLLGYTVSRLLKKEALGGGDIKLYIFIGFSLTLIENLLSLFLASLIALIYAFIAKKTKSYIPLVPFIGLAVMIIYMFGQDIISWYLSLFGM